MTQLTVRGVSPEVAHALRKRAVENGRSAEAEHREILRSVLVGKMEEFSAQAAKLRRRLQSDIDSSDLIRADRDRDSKK